jgi:hypothetical protein
MSTDLTTQDPHGPAGTRLWTLMICIGGSVAMAIALAMALVSHHEHVEHSHAPDAWMIGTLPFALILGAPLHFYHSFQRQPGGGTATSADSWYPSSAVSPR